MKLKYIGPLHQFVDENSNVLYLTIENAKALADVLTQDRKGQEVEIINADTKAKELLNPVKP